MTMKYTHEPVYKANSGDVENFIKEIFGQVLDINVDQGGDAPNGCVIIDVVDTGISLGYAMALRDWEQNKVVNDPWGDYLLDTILNELCTLGHIPAGKWYIRIE